MTIITSQKESGESTKVPLTKIVDSSICLGGDNLYQHPTPVELGEYLEQRRHNRAWLRQWLVTWCGKALLTVSIAIMLFALIILLLSWAEGYPSVREDPHSLLRTSDHLQRSGNVLERLDPPYGQPQVPVDPYDSRENDSTGLDPNTGVFSSFDSVVQAMRRRFQGVFNQMREMMSNADSLPPPSATDNDTQVVRRISIDGNDFVQTRQVLRKPLPDGQGMIVVVRQQLIPVGEFYGNGTTTLAPATPAEPEEANTVSQEQEEP
jgi:hypothetical protein